jgi:hypothetical protein
MMQQTVEGFSPARGLTRVRRDVDADARFSHMIQARLPASTSILPERCEHAGGGHG